MNRYIVIALLLACCVAVAAPRTRTTQRNLRTNELAVEPLPAASADSAVAAGIDQGDVTLRGFAKRASDAKESFLVTNNTQHRISAIRIKLRYTTLDGTMIHERMLTVPIMLNPGETQLATVKSFDAQRQYYFYAGPAPRKAATPFQVAYRLMGYDIPVGY